MDVEIIFVLTVIVQVLIVAGLAGWTIWLHSDAGMRHNGIDPEEYIRVMKSRW